MLKALALPRKCPFCEIMTQAGSRRLLRSTLATEEQWPGILRACLPILGNVSQNASEQTSMAQPQQTGGANIEFDLPRRCVACGLQCQLPTAKFMQKASKSA